MTTLKPAQPIVPLDVDALVEGVRPLSVDVLGHSTIRVITRIPIVEMLPSERDHLITAGAVEAARALGTSASDLVLVSAHRYGTYLIDMTFV